MAAEMALVADDGRSFPGRYWLCDTEAECLANEHALEGDLAYCRDTQLLYLCKGAAKRWEKVK